MKRFFGGIAFALLLLAGAGAWVWNYRPEWLPQEWRRANPNSREYMPAVYRWKDDRGVVQLTDTPPKDRPYEEVRIDPRQNVVPNLGPAD